MNIRCISLGDRVSGWLSGFPETITSLALGELFGGAEVRAAFRVRKGRGCTRRSALKASPDHSEEESFEEQASQLMSSGDHFFFFID